MATRRIVSGPGPARGAIRNQTQVQSRVNGLLINIPTDARGITPRFASQGGNELVFAPLSEKQKAVEEPDIRIDTSGEANKSAEPSDDLV